MKPWVYKASYSRFQRLAELFQARAVFEKFVGQSLEKVKVAVFG